MNLVTPERWYVLWWTMAGVIGLGPIYWALWQIVRLLQDIRFILSVTKNG